MNTSDKQLRTAALYTICIAADDDDICNAFVDADCPAQLMRVCQTEDRDVLELATETFGNMARSAKGVYAMREAGAFPLLVRLISPASTSAADGAVAALVAASADDKGRVTIAALDGVAPLLKLMATSDVDRRDKILWSVPNWCQGTTAETVMSVALSTLVALLSKGKESVQSVALKSVLLLATTAENRPGLVRARVPEALQALESTTSNPTLRAAASKARGLLVGK